MASVFSRIIAGELPARFVYTDDDVVAFLSIAPLTVGHTLVVPRAEVDEWQTVDPQLWLELAAVAQRVGRAIDAAFHPVRVGTLVAGFEVPHLHVHVFAADEMGDFDFRRAAARDDATMDAAAEQIRAALAALPD
jgi:histidine triad (HIT) family protein